MPIPEAICNTNISILGIGKNCIIYIMIPITMETPRGGAMSLQSNLLV